MKIAEFRLKPLGDADERAYQALLEALGETGYESLLAVFSWRFAGTVHFEVTVRKSGLYRPILIYEMDEISKGAVAIIDESLMDVFSLREALSRILGEYGIESSGFPYMSLYEFERIFYQTLEVYLNERGAKCYEDDEEISAPLAGVFWNWDYLTLMAIMRLKSLTLLRSLD